MDDNFARIFPFELTKLKKLDVWDIRPIRHLRHSYTPSNRNELTGLLSNLLTYLLTWPWTGISRDTFEK